MISPHVAPSLAFSDLVSLFWAVMMITTGTGSTVGRRAVGRSPRLSSSAQMTGERWAAANTPPATPEPLKLVPAQAVVPLAAAPTEARSRGAAPIALPPIARDADPARYLQDELELVGGRGGGGA